MHKGWLALDIDGTLTGKDHVIPKPVLEFLQKQHEAGWSLAFITGRFLRFAKTPLKDVSFPYYLAVQNGSDIYSMPEEKCLCQQYLSKELIPSLDAFYEGMADDYILYTGPANGDAFYYRKKRYSDEMLQYLEKLALVSGSPAIAIEEFKLIPQEKFPLIKCFGTYQEMQLLSEQVGSTLQVAQSVIKDPFSTEKYLNLINHPLGNKGRVVDALMQHSQLKGSVIAAGNDLNDLSLLQRADYSIAITGAPEALIKEADFVGDIIEGLEKALKELS